MQFLLGLKLLNSRAKPQQTEGEVGTHGGTKQRAAQKRSSSGGGKAKDWLKAVQCSSSRGLSESKTELSEEPDPETASLSKGSWSAQRKSILWLLGRRSSPASEGGPAIRKHFDFLESIQVDEIFTNHESLPSIEQAYKQFKVLYPEYLGTSEIDEIRAREYLDLDESGRVCLDYSGYGLFSKWQEKFHKSTASFGLSYISVNLPTHALYGSADKGTAEHDVKQTILTFLNIQESEYEVVFTASRGTAFKLLGESYPFHMNKRLLSVYDYESEGIAHLEEAAQKYGAKIMSAQFRWPSQRLRATDLKKKLSEKRSRREPGKGLFVFPIQSRVTGAKYSYQWMSHAQDNGWDIVVDASALGPNAMATLGLCFFRPEFIVSSFFKVYGSDPTGFGCLLIKRSAIQRLHNSSAARAVGVVRLVPTSSLPEMPLEGNDVRDVEIVVAGSARYPKLRHLRPLMGAHIAGNPLSPSCKMSFSASGKEDRSELVQFSEAACMVGPSLSTNDTVLLTSGKKEEISDHIQVPETLSSSPAFKQHRASNWEVVEISSLPSIHPPARKTIDEAPTSSTFMLSEQHGQKTLQSNSGLSASAFPSDNLPQKGGHGPTSASSSTSSDSTRMRRKEASSCNPRMPTDRPSSEKVSPDNQKKLGVLDGKSNTYRFQGVEIESGDGFPPKFSAQEDELSLGESKSSFDYCSSNRIDDDGPITSFLHLRQHSCVFLANDQHNLPHVYREATSSALFFDGADDSADLSNTSITREGDEEEERKLEGEDGETSVKRKEPEIQCRGLFHACKVGLNGTNIRLRCLINWLTASMLKLQHPGSPTSHQLVQIYGPKVDDKRGASVAFNVTDWKGDLLHPLLVQRLADRNNISIGITILNHTHVPKKSVRWTCSFEPNNSNSVSMGHTGEAVSNDKSSRFQAITIGLCFLSNFEDCYKFWHFLANFLDADFISKEAWCYRSLNQATIVLGVDAP